MKKESNADPPIQQPKRMRRMDVSILSKKNKEFREWVAKTSNDKVFDIRNKEKQILKVSPEEVIFRDAVPGQIYQMKVVVKNKTAVVRRIRIFQPRSGFFRCDYELAGRIAPGLSIDLIISFEGKSKGEFSDSIKIISDDDYEYEMQLLAYSPMAKIIFEPFVNLGFVQVGKQKIEMIWFKNEGNDDGKVEISCGDFAYLTTEPRGPFVISPGEKKAVQICYEAHESGIFRGIMQVASSGKTFLNSIDVNATCVDYMQFFIDRNGREMEEIKFGEILFGKTSKFNGFLVNNSPEPLFYKINSMRGHYEHYKKENDLKSPHEIGMEQTQKVLTIMPNEGFIDSYTQIPLDFICHSDAEDDHRIWTNNYCISKGELEGDPITKDIKYTCVIFFSKGAGLPNEESLTKVVNVEALATCPKVALSCSGIKFGSCILGKVLIEEIWVRNDGNCPVKLSFARLSHFSVEPKLTKIASGEKQILKVKFSPKNLGKIKIIGKFMVNSDFPLGFNLEGLCIPKPGKVIDSSSSLRKKPFTQGGSTRTPTIRSQYSSSQASIRPLKANKKFEYLKDSRVKRLKDKKDRRIHSRIEEVEKMVQENMSTLAGNKEQQEKTIGKRDSSTHFFKLDMELRFKDTKNGLEAPNMDLPEAEPSLFVTKPIGKYEPQEKTLTHMLNPDILGFLKPQPTKPPANSSMARDINQALDGEMLKKIHAGPKLIEFGRLFVNSNTTKYFYIRNDLKGAISARMILDDPCFSKSYAHTQIMSSGTTACFSVCFEGKEIGNISKIVTYKINERHEFKFMIKAFVMQVELEVSTQKLEIDFQDDDTSLQTSRTITLKNKGNSEATFEWICSSPSFVFEPQKGVVKAEGTLPIKVIYIPDPKKTIDNVFVDLRIKDGKDQVIELLGKVVECNTVISPKALNFDALAVAEKKDIVLTLNNESSKYPAVFVINEEKLPPIIKLSKTKGKIYQVSNEKIFVTFCSPVPDKFSFNIELNWRGGHVMSIPVEANVIVPNIMVYEDEFKFGTITYGNSAELFMTIENTSPIPAKVKLDLRRVSAEETGIECLKCEQVIETDDDTIIINEIEPSDIDAQIITQEAEKPDKKKLEGALHNVAFDISDQENSIEEEDESNNGDGIEHDHYKNFYSINLEPNKIYKMKLIFTPQNTIRYSFRLPLYLGNPDERNPNLAKLVTCNSVAPKIVLDPINGVRDFKKLIIPYMEAPRSETMILSIKNPDENSSLNFFIDLEQLMKDRVFTLSKNEGTIKPLGTTELYISYKPHIPGAWSFRLPVYLDDDRENKKAEIILKGEAAQPKIFFDRRQIIMPVVPLGIKSKLMFRIYNEGYQNVTLKVNIPDDVVVPLKIKFPEGSALTSRKNSVLAEISFVANKSISFNIKLSFEDEHDNLYWIFCSGTADNCLLTNYFFFTRQPTEALILTDGIDPIMAVSQLPEKSISEDAKSVDGNQSMTFSKTSGKTKGFHVTLGYSPIPFEEILKQCKFMSFWLCKNIQSVAVSDFPEDLIFENGKQLIMILHFFTKKAYSQPLKFKADIKKSERAEKLYQFYLEIISSLMEQGALLNEIRPEFLFGYQDYLTYIKTFPVSNVHPGVYKIKENEFNYISMHAWVVLFNQILKMFYLDRINIHKFKAIKIFDDKEKAITKEYLNNSNVYSQAEIILLKWAEIVHTKVRTEKKRIFRFDTDLQNGHSLACIIQFYTKGSIVPFRHMKEVTQTDLEKAENLRSVRDSLMELGFNAIPGHSDFVSQTPMQRVILMTDIFLLIPFFIPKDEIFFECILSDTIVKSITLNNSSHGSKAIYIVEIEGSSDFTIQQDQVVLEPGQTFNFPVTFYARISREVKAKITFKGDRDSISTITPLVFTLTSKIVGRRSSERLEIDDVPLYERKTKDVIIANPFSKDVVFTVTLQHLPSVSSKKKINFAKNVGVSHQVMPSFFLITKKVHVPAKKVSKVKVAYLPITFEVHLCNLICVDERVGELQYDLVGVPQLPLVKEILPLTTNLDNNRIEYLPLSLPYPQRQTAIDELMRFSVSEEDPVREIIRRFVDKQKNSEVFRVEVAGGSKDISYPNQITLYNKQMLQGDEIRRKEDNNHLRLTLNFRNPVKDFSSRFMLKNFDLSDIRVYECLITVYPKVFKATIEFDTSARVPLTQEIPVTNPLNTEVDFRVERIQTEDINARLFSFPTHLKVPCDKTEYLRVTFNPTWVMKATTELQIVNPITSEKFIYKLRGSACDPLAEEHLKFKCDVGTRQNHQIKIENPSEVDKVYKVDIDLNGIAGDSNFRVRAGKAAYYTLKIEPTIGGVYAGSITFTDENEQYFWYSMEIESQGQRNVKDLEIISTIRKEIVTDIPVINNAGEDIEYQVSIKGRDLYGNAKIFVDAKSQKTYKLTFLPLATYTDQATVSFINSKVGELIYNIRLGAMADKAKKLPLFQAEVGKFSSQDIELLNPSGFKAKIKAVNLTPELFEIIPEKLEVAPYNTAKFRINYIPNELDVEHSGELEFHSKQLGDWKYILFGTGSLPTPFPLREITALLNKEGSEMIEFKNPFKITINMQIFLEARNGEDSIFSLKYNNHTKIILKPGGDAQINVSYLPQEIRDYECKLVLRLNDKISWIYPIKLVTEAETPSKELNITTVCRKSKKAEFTVPLPGLSSMSEDDCFEVSLSQMVGQEMNLIKRWLKIDQDHVKFNAEKAELAFHVSFTPMKPFRAGGEIIVTRISGGIWKYLCF